jgi:NTP pyrophosphatase (non-canonical NTP hydrolase)
MIFDHRDYAQKQIDGEQHDTRLAVFEEMAQEVHDVNHANGWFDSGRTVGEGIALLHSEVSEAFDAWRKHGFEDVTTESLPADKPEGYGSELADVLIRLLDQADRDGVNLVAEFERKLAYNRTRGYRHGGRKI